MFADDAAFKEIIPLPEDVELKDLQCLKAVQEKRCWKWRKIISLNLDQEVSVALHVNGIFFLSTTTLWVARKRMEVIGEGESRWIGGKRGSFRILKSAG